jgi:sigma-E factor negative regulatory protein RseC
MSSSSSVIHPGIVDQVEMDWVRVRILSKSACSSCHAKQACLMSEMEEKVIEVPVRETEKYSVGQSVMVTMEESMGRKAVVLGYVLPLFVLVASVFIFLTFIKNEGLAALLAMAMLVPYYGILYLFRNRLRKEFSFRISNDEQ